jgi:hypothetical protein
MHSLFASVRLLGEATYGVLELAEQARPYLDAGDGTDILEAATDEFVSASSIGAPGPCRPALMAALAGQSVCL